MPNGDLDSEFGGDGKVVTVFQEGIFDPSAVAIDARARYVVVGERGNFFTVARYLRNGTLDSEFGNGGATVATEFPGGISQARAVLVNVIGEEIVAVGQVGRQFGLARFREDGQLDFSFGNNGKVQTPIGTTDEQSMAEAVAADSQGRLIVAGKIFPKQGDDV